MKKRTVKTEAQRREEIISAAFAVIYEVGLSGATIAKIAKKAEVSFGMVSHYFDDKQSLMVTCMRELLKRLHQTTLAKKSLVDTNNPEQMIKAIIHANFDRSQVNKLAMRVWLDFWSASLHHPELARLQHVNEMRLYSNLKFHFLKVLSPQDAHIAAQGLAALIDGLWLRGGLNRHNQFDLDHAEQIAYAYLAQQLAHPTPN